MTICKRVTLPTTSEIGASICGSSRRSWACSGCAVACLSKSKSKESEKQKRLEHHLESLSCGRAGKRKQPALFFFTLQGKETRPTTLTWWQVASNRHLRQPANENYPKKGKAPSRFGNLLRLFARWRWFFGRSQIRRFYHASFITKLRTWCCFFRLSSSLFDEIDRVIKF